MEALQGDRNRRSHEGQGHTVSWGLGMQKPGYLDEELMLMG